MNTDKFEYKCFIDYLEQLCSSRKTGIVYMTCDQNHSARMVLAAGKIIVISYANKKGNDAIAAMSKIQQISYRFDSSNVSVNVDDSLPPTSVIIRNIAPIGYTKETDTFATNVDNASTMSVPSDIAKSRINNLLLDLVGPMGNFLYADYVENAVSKEEIINHLSKELSTVEMEAVYNILN
ncbi:DUF4388 domain-containing protein [Psychrobacter sp. I-STPA10]|uniref:DUF4388 domain-containing protein n=1 Tax=Psychrobacter sp. I-STPA10 TaxID=2585769 RepID=UPI001E2AA31D|nr:DUF4388 domain-containing protein [Psychrobacter sp. I-STPA10]